MTAVLLGIAAAVLVQTAPKQAEDPFVRGQELSREGRVQEAEEAFRQAMAESPASPWPHYGLAELRFKENRTNKAIEIIGKAIQLGQQEPGSLPTFHMARAIYRFSLGELQQAEGDLLAVLEKSGSNAYAHFQLALIYIDQGRHKEAKDQAMAMVRLGERKDLAYYLIGKVLFKDGKLPEAKAVLLKAIDLDPRNGQAHFTLSKVLMQLGEKEEANKAMEVHLHLQRLQEKVDKLIGPGRTEEKVVPSWRILSLLHCEEGEYEDAKVYAERVLRSRPGDSEGMFVLGHIQTELGEIAEAIQTFSKCIELHPGYYPSYNNLAHIYATRQSVRNPEEAVRLAEKAKKLGSPQVGTLAEAYFSRGEVERACKILEEAIAGDHTHKEEYKKQLERFRSTSSPPGEKGQTEEDQTSRGEEEEPVEIGH